MKNHRIYAALLCFILTLTVCCASASLAAAAPLEQPAAIYSGNQAARVILDNINFMDVAQLPAEYWAKDAIYEMAALDVIKGYGDRNFGYSNYVTREQALALIYKLAGREKDAQQAAEMLDSRRRLDEKKKNAISMWSDGYIQLALNDGLITLQDYMNAMDENADPPTDDAAFVRSGAAQRQEVAAWVAKALKLEPVYGQQAIFNSFNDWSAADPVKIPYVEAALKNNIMSGYPEGAFYPLSPVRREEMAQILKNAEALALPLLKMEKMSGWIESINHEVNKIDLKTVYRTALQVRNSSGKLHEIRLESEYQPGEPIRREFYPGDTVYIDKDVVVYKDKQIGMSGLLSQGDPIEYVVDEGKTVRFVKALPRSGTIYIAAKVEDLDPVNRMVRVTQFYQLDGPAWKGNSGQKPVAGADEGVFTYRVSDGAAIFGDDGQTALEQLLPGSFVSLTVQEGMITQIRMASFETGRDAGVIKGIVEENNLQLGYLSLYDEYGRKDSSALRVFYYENPSEVEVQKDHSSAALEDIEPGDTAFIRLNQNANIISVSAVSYYTPKYGKVINRNARIVTVEYEDGQQQVLDLEDDLFVIKNKKVIDLDQLKDGDNVKLLLHITDGFTRLKEITIESSGLMVAGIYKGTVSYIDDPSGEVVVSHMEVLEKGKWERTNQKVFSSLKLDNDCSFFHKDKKVNRNKVNQYFRENEAYIVTEKDYGNREKVVLISYRSMDDTEKGFVDKISRMVTGSGEMNLEREMFDVKFMEGSIILKDGRLVTPNTLDPSDSIYLIANRDYYSGEYYAGIVQVNTAGTAGSAGYAVVYRGRISGINENRDITFDSFSQLEGVEWNFYNTPRTFRITYDTKILGDSGVMGVREFTAYGSNPNLDSTVYVVADGADALLISTAPFAARHVMGEIYSIRASGTAGGTAGDSEDSVYGIKEVRVYNPSTGVWDEETDGTFKLLPNSIIIKNKKIVEAMQLKEGDRVRVIRRDGAAATAGASIIIAE